MDPGTPLSEGEKKKEREVKVILKVPPVPMPWCKASAEPAPVGPCVP